MISTEPLTVNGFVSGLSPLWLKELNDCNHSALIFGRSEAVFKLATSDNSVLTPQFDASNQSLEDLPRPRPALEIRCSI
jgi:hypothetical protein